MQFFRKDNYNWYWWRWWWCQAVAGVLPIADIEPTYITFIIFFFSCFKFFSLCIVLRTFPTAQFTKLLSLLFEIIWCSLNLVIVPGYLFENWSHNKSLNPNQSCCIFHIDRIGVRFIDWLLVYIILFCFSFFFKCQQRNIDNIQIFVTVQTLNW